MRVFAMGMVLYLYTSIGGSQGTSDYSCLVMPIWALTRVMVLESL